MLGLTHQVSGNDGRVGAVVGNHRRLGGASDHINANPAKQQAFGLGHKAVAGPNDDVSRSSREQAMGQRRHALHPTQRQHGADAANLHGIQDGGVDAVLRMRRRGGHDVPHTGHRGGAHAHDGAGSMGIAATRHIAASRLTRNQPLADRQARYQFGRKFLHRIALAPGKVLHPVARKADILLDALAQRGLGPDKGLRAHDHRPVPAIKLGGIGLGHRLAAGCNGVQHGAHRVSRGGVVAWRERWGPLEVFDRHATDGRQDNNVRIMPVRNFI